MRLGSRLEGCASLAVAAAILSFLAAPSSARAQAYTATLEPFAYEDMPITNGGNVTNTNVKGWLYSPLKATVSLPFPVTFYGTTYSELTILGMGVVTFGATYSGVDVYPSGLRDVPVATSSLHNFVAVWWGDIICNDGGGSTLGTQEVGTSPNRWFVIEWHACRIALVGTSSVSAQLWLPEDGGDFFVAYGPISGTTSASAMGIENLDGTDGTPGISASGTNCNPNCVLADFPTGQRIVYSSGPPVPSVSLDAVSVTPQPVNIGHPMDVSAIVTNNRGADLEGAAVQLWLGPSTLISQAQPLGVVTGTIPGNSSASLSLPVDTSALSPGTYFVIAEFDPFHEIFPADAPGPILASDPLLVKVPTAALRVLGGTVNAPGWVASGGTFDVSWDMDNRDLLEATSARFTIVLSTDSNVDASDRVIDAGYFSLGAGKQLTVAKPVTLPDDVPDGTYFVGVWLDPAEEIPHVDRTGNKRMSVTPTTVGLELDITTSELPGGRVGEAYSANLAATGGDNAYTWTVVAGSLPAGLSIVGSGGVNRIAGTPNKAGVSTFTLQAASDRFTDTATYSVEILPAIVPLEVLTGGNLPNATLGRGYSVILEAHGGTPPYLWSIDSGTTPAGLTLSPDGRFGGTPIEQGSFPIFVRVADAAGAGVTSLFTLDVIAEPLVCENVTGHAPVMAGEAIHPIRLMATGGVAPYRWSTVSGAVPGLVVSAAGEISGTANVAGTYDWALEVADAQTSTVRCHVTLSVTEQPKETDLVISTTSLPRGQVTDSYEATLEATGFTGTVTWSMGIDGVLPEGLLLTSSGTILGVPSPTSLGTEKVRTFRFEVVATDAAQKEARATLEIELFDDRPPVEPVVSTKTEKKGGCQSGSGDAGLLALGLALGMATLVRRTRG